MSAPERSAPAVEPVLEGRRAPGASGAGADQRTLRGLVRYFLKLGASGFGGPIALVGYMQRDLVEERGWFSQAEFEQAVAVGQTMPGPLAAQAAMWFGYLHAGARGAFAIALPFVISPFLIVTALNAALSAEFERRRELAAAAFGARMVRDELELIRDTVAASLRDGRWGAILDPGLPYARGLWAVEHREGTRAGSAWPVG